MWSLSIERYDTLTKYRKYSRFTYHHTKEPEMYFFRNIEASWISNVCWFILFSAPSLAVSWVCAYTIIPTLFCILPPTQDHHQYVYKQYLWLENDMCIDNSHIYVVNYTSVAVPFQSRTPVWGLIQYIKMSTSIWNLIMEIRRSYDRLISTIGFPIYILVRWHLYIESVPQCIKRSAIFDHSPTPIRYINTVKPVCNDHLYNEIYNVIYSIMWFNDDRRYQFTRANNLCLLELI